MAYCIAVGYSAQNITENISVPTYTSTIPALTVNGWIIFQQRLNPSDSFEYLWNDYKNGFQSTNGSFWLGNEIVYQLTSSGNYKLRMEMLSPVYGWVSAEYYSFQLDDEAGFYRINLAGYSGDCGDSMDYDGDNDWYYNDGMYFTTLDSDNDLLEDGNCAQERGGGWWYNECFYALFNGNGSEGMTWNTLPDPYLSVTRMMLKKLD